MTETGGHVDTRSVLFTDLVASTELRVELGEEAADALRRRHDEVLHETITANGGTVVKGLGDGVMATFNSAAEAVAAAVAVQQAVHHERFDVRIGVSIGDVNVEDGDVFGVPVVEASRLCSIATAGEILAAELVRALARGRGGFVFEPMGDLALKGLPDPVPATRVVWEPLPDLSAAAADGAVPLPPALFSGMNAVYIGRDDLMQKLESYWRAATTGRAHCVLLAGEPGVGKTRTAAELARRAHADGAVVLYGRCEEGLGAPYQPYIEALDHYTAYTTDTLGRLPGELRRLLPDLASRVADLPEAAQSDPGSEEHRLFEATTSWLIDVAASPDTNAGLVLVLDDLHWATKPTLLLTLHLLRAATEQGAPLLVVVTYRDTDIDRAHPLSGVLADLRRLPAVIRQPVDNLTEAEVVDLMASAAGHELDEAGLALAEVVYAETEGNPFFITEVLRHLIETGGIRREGDRWVPGADLDALAIPEGVRDVVGRRLSRLSERANEVLSTAAVVGREMDVNVLVALSDSGEDAVLDALDEAVRARLMEETSVDRFRFAHALVRTTLYEELSATRRRRLHRRVADALEKLRPDDVVALAYHCDEGGPEGGDISRAVRYGLAAAEQSLASRAFADAEARFRHVLDQLEDAEEAEPPEAVAALVGLGECQRDQGNPAFRETLLDASRRGLELGLTESLVRAVLANSRGVTSIVGDVDAERIELIEAALDAVGSLPTADRARLLALLAGEVSFEGDDDRRVALADEAEAMARSLGDRALLGYVLVQASYAAIVPSRRERLVERGAEAAAIADEIGDPSLRVYARLFYSAALLFMGRFEEHVVVTDEMIDIAEREASPAVRWAAQENGLRVTMAIRGGVVDAQPLNDALLVDGQEMGEPDALQWWGAVMCGVMWVRGDGADMADAVGVFASQYPRLPIWRCGHAWFLAEAGRLDEARHIIDTYVGQETFEDSSLPLCGPTQLAHVAYLLDDAEIAARAAEVLGRYPGCWGHYYLVTFGPVSWHRGLALAVLGRLDEAIALVTEGEAELDRLEVSDWLARCRGNLAELLLRRDGPGDRQRAIELAGAAREHAVAMNAPNLVARVDALLSR